MIAKEWREMSDEAKEVRFRSFYLYPYWKETMIGC
jgi:hypothetical protein